MFYYVILSSASHRVKPAPFAASTGVAMFRNRMPRYEILSPDAVAVLDAGWRRIVTEIGVQFAKPEAVELFRKAGQKVEEDVVFLDPEFVLEQVAKAPREFDVQARNPANSVHIGGDP